MSACPNRILLIHALADGELDAANAVALDAHLATCPGCTAALDEITALSRAIAAAPDLSPPASAALRARVEAIGARVRAPAATRWRWAGGGAAVALAASLALVVALPIGQDRGIEDEVVASHVRSLLPGHLIDVATSDRHVVKPWFNGRIDFAPPVVDLKAQGFPLVGGRLDYLGDRTVAALVYRRDRHFINLLVRPVRPSWFGAGDSDTHRDGYTILHWRQGGLDYWAISDVDPAALGLFRADFQRTTS